MIRFLLLLSLLHFIALESYSQSSMDGLVEEIEHYRSNSNELRKIVETFEDTCQALYGCTGVRKLSFSPSTLFDSIGEIDISAELLIEPGYLQKRAKLGKVILMIDSVKILVGKSILFDSCLGDSVEYLGKKEFELKYEEFESCLHQFGVVMTMKFTCLPGEPPQVHHYGAYLPTSGKKKLQEYKKNAETECK